MVFKWLFVGLLEPEATVFAVYFGVDVTFIANDHRPSPALYRHVTVAVSPSVANLISTSHGL